MTMTQSPMTGGDERRAVEEAVLRAVQAGTRDPRKLIVELRVTVPEPGVRHALHRLLQSRRLRLDEDLQLALR